MDWSKIPDVLAVASLACAFFSISRQNRTAQHHLWLLGWIMIAIHFIGFMFANIPGVVGTIGSIVGLISLIDAGVFFMWATVPSESGISSRRMALVTLFSMAIYAGLACLDSAPGWAFDACAVFIAIGPLAVGLFYIRYAQHALRWLTVGLQFALGAELLVLRRQSGGNNELCIDAILFVVYLGCCLYFLYTHKIETTGSIITVGGFFAWAMVFVIAPAMGHYMPNFKIEDEVWNLPKYVVAIGMLLLLLEKQIERSQYLALHDDLTALANRRLFQDRLISAMERARRSGSTIALMQVDLDRFKEVNDSFGHHVGDLLLQHVAALLDRRVRRSDTVARTGGDEFSIILEEPSTRRDAEMVAESLIVILAEPFQLAGKMVRVGASIGIAVFPDDAQDSDSLCIEADLRMYQVKQDRREATRVPREKVMSHFDSQTLAS
ncbi:GGDEF domain-containing protein [Acidicapsa acidisoli]|uniref:GGDEF domain-containing protein n=1 Tax=Acidicapsa acidisoli TaxID=1615681 RepID=UPI0021DFE367|nr:GGDEF domain-containing protein [Acidicapsa acidisoli]